MLSVCHLCYFPGAQTYVGYIIFYAPPLIGGALSDDAVWRLSTSVWRLSVAYIWPKLRTEKHRKTKIGTEVAHVTRDSDTTFKVKRSRSPGRFTHRGVIASGSYSGGGGNVLSVGTFCYDAVCRCSGLGGARRFGATEGQGRGHIVAAARLQLVILRISCFVFVLLTSATWHSVQCLTVTFCLSASVFMGLWNKRMSDWL